MNPLIWFLWAVLTLMAGAFLYDINSYGAPSIMTWTLWFFGVHGFVEYILNQYRRA